MNVYRRAIQKLRSEGIQPFLASIPDMVTNYARPPIVQSLARAVDAGLCGPLVDENELERIARERGKWFEFASSDRCEIPGPAHLPSELTEFAGTYETRRRFIAELSEITLFGHDALAMDSNYRLILESIGGHQWFVAYILYRYAAERRFRTVQQLIRRQPVRHERQYGTVFPLLGPHSRTYFHWIAEFLPRLRALEEWQAETGQTAKILVNPDPPAWKVESLRCLGYEGDQVIEWNGTGVAERVLIAPYSPKRLSLYTPSPADYRWLRDRMQECATEPSMGCPNTILVSRRDAPNRNILNEDALLEEFSSMGLTRVVPGELSIPEQIGIFTGANTVIGPHGAGLANIIFSDESQLIECFQSDLIRPHFFHLANELNHKYDCILGERKEQDMVISANDLQENLSE
jgi:capsular polysaccharide biosynthesis protein